MYKAYFVRLIFAVCQLSVKTAKLDTSKIIHYMLDHIRSCNKYCDLIGQEKVTICDSYLHDSDSHLQLHSLEHEAKLGSILGYRSKETVAAIKMETVVVV